ncbi:MAG TPA: DUF4097 family beta strand repeat-containing protein [Pyrinomonadaceae bacterium]|nr:DUF4097 family beta strand repeat-containing protein [Pyrinomonadaceae bacterium]
MRQFLRGAAIAVAAAFFVGMPLDDAFGQKTESGFCNNYNFSSDRVSFSEVREFALPASGRLTVDGGKNGGIAVKGGPGSEVIVRACVNAWAKTDDAARTVAQNISIETGGEIKAQNTVDDSNWSVSYLITVPRNTDLELRAKNGGIAISGVEGTIEFETVNGGVSLKNVAGDVRGRTTNGGVNVALAGTTWSGAGLDVVTTNGGVKLSLPAMYAANIETGTVNGGFKSEIAGLEPEDDGERRHRAKRISTSINGGGAPIKVFTTNGGVKISSAEGRFEL